MNIKLFLLKYVLHILPRSNKCFMLILLIKLKRIQILTMLQIYEIDELF